MTILSRRLILLAILLYEAFLHLAQINLHPNKQFLSTQQHAYQSFLLLLWLKLTFLFLVLFGGACDFRLLNFVFRVFDFRLLSFMFCISACMCDLAPPRRTRKRNVSINILYCI